MKVFESSGQLSSFHQQLYVSIHSDDQALIAHMEAARGKNDKYISGADSSRLLLNALSQREYEVFRLMIAGDGNKQIAKTLQLSFHTVKRHVANILAKLNCSTRGQAAARWRTM